MTERSPDSPGVIVIPPLLYLGTLIVGVILHVLVPLPAFPPLPARIVGVVLIVASAALARWGERTMRRAGTNVRPDRPTLAIVTDGPFRFSRNPLYVSLTGLYLGIALIIDDVWPLVLVVPLLIVMRWGVVAREERYLDAKFGEPYRAYRARVRRWL